jgi:molecular chaperone GrpE (heat shock protein)
MFVEFLFWHSTHFYNHHVPFLCEYINKMLQSSNKYTATATILTEFLPAMDALNSLKERYENNDFGKMYNALPDAIRTGYISMGCTEYTIESNTMFDPNRMTMIDAEPSTTVPKDGVIRTVIPGMELQGNSIRLAQVVTSAGNNSENMTDALMTPPQ